MLRKGCSVTLWVVGLEPHFELLERGEYLHPKLGLKEE